MYACRVASFFQDVKTLQQDLLQENSTIKRLGAEKQVLEDTVKMFSARSVLFDLFEKKEGTPGSSAGAGEEELPGLARMEELLARAEGEELQGMGKKDGETSSSSPAGSSKGDESSSSPGGSKGDDSSGMLTEEDMPGA